MVLSYLTPYIRHIIVIGLAAVLFVVLSREPNSHYSETNIKEAAPDEKQATSGERLFTDQELAEYDGREGSKGLYLVILGYVYDVQKGVKHYGPGEAYNMFVGHDASRSFISGDFEEYDPEMSDVSSLTDSELKSIVKWKSFYDENYVYKGKVVGRYFDERGELTEYHKIVLKRVAKAEEEEAKPKQEFPSCNVEWKQETGTKVWCSSRSGDGVERGWVGKPRKYVERKDETPYCVCVPDEAEQGETLVPFEDCDPISESCLVKDSK
ncbi:neuferricin homolog [Ochlerotatus camptorhynchus]|uniref:neuferricin homolog n=1 Tax=Ochlerotatus camptorhynchus TaxID=644619 RepID=UPI0031D6785B